MSSNPARFVEMLDEQLYATGRRKKSQTPTKQSEYPGSAERARKILALLTARGKARWVQESGTAVSLIPAEGATDPDLSTRTSMKGASVAGRNGSARPGSGDSLATTSRASTRPLL
jgi:hypothetical protein